MSQKSAFLSRFTPSLMPPEALEGIFVQREPLAREIVDRLREAAFGGPAVRMLLFGPRGIGKTHLISLIYYRLRASADLRDRLLLAWLREEEFGVTSFLDLVLRILHALAGEHEDKPEFAGRVQALYHLPPDKAELAALELLGVWMRGRSLLVLAENLDELFSGLGARGQTRLLRFLREQDNCSLLASSQVPLEAMASPGVQFGGIFQVRRLEELSYEEAVGLLSKIAVYQGDRELPLFLSTARGRARVRALKYLAGGNHRAYVIFSQFLSRESLDDLIEPLMRTIDDLTPYYQSRMAALSPEQRKIMAFVCECRKPVPVRDVARRCFMKAEAASLHLERLAGLGYLNAMAVGNDRYYELSEPLMRLSIEVKKHRDRPVQLLIDFLRLWYSPAELRQGLASLAPDAALERAYVVPALEAAGDGREHPRVAPCCLDYNAAVARRDFAAALRAAEELVAVRGSVQDFLAQAFCLKSLGRWEAAVACYDSVIAMDPQNVLVWILRASALGRLGRYAEAVSSCDRAIELDGRAARAWGERGSILLQAGNPREALASLEKALELDERDFVAWLSRGMALSDLGCYEEALPCFEKASALERADPMPLVYLGAALMELKRHDQALARADEAIGLDAGLPLAWALRGTALAALERYEEALDSFERALERGERSSFVAFKRAQLLLRLGRWREGSAALDQALARFAHARQADAGNTAELVRMLQSDLENEKALRLRIKVLVLLYCKHGALNALGQGLVESIPDLLSPVFSDASAGRWLDAWQSLAGAHPEFTLPLHLLAAAVAYRETHDPRSLMHLPPEERSLLEPLLGVKLQATA